MIRGTCMYCNQVIMVEEADINGDLEDEDAITQAAVMKCNCTGAKIYQGKEKRKEALQDNITLIFHKSSEDMESLMYEALPYILKGAISKITVDTANGLRGIMSIGTNDTIKIKCTIKKEKEYSE